MDHLEQIAKIGGTDKVYKESTFKGLDALFQNIAINPSYGLKSNNCINQNKCYLECEHKEQNNLKEETCNNCNLELVHKENSSFKIQKEKYICKKKCKKENCINRCKLIVNHKGECICGICICGEYCKYKNKSHNCKQKCHKIYGHSEAHKCEVKTHLCIQKCIYADKTRKIDGGCLKYCAFPINHEKFIKHFCGIEQDKHICSGICHLYDKSLNGSCDKFCNKSVNHENECLCKYSIQIHKCKNKCQFSNNEEIRGCFIDCDLPANHEKNTGVKCICSVRENHLCNKIDAGAEYIITQPVFDTDSLFRFIDKLNKKLSEPISLPIVAGIWPLVSYKNAVFLKTEVPGVSVPDSIIERMEKAKTKEDGVKIGLDIAIEMKHKLSSVVQGYQISAPFGKVECAIDVINN